MSSSRARTKRTTGRPVSQFIDALEGRRLLTSVSGFDLINADTGAVLSPLTKTTIINTIALGTPHLNVQADTDATTQSVHFTLDGGNDVIDSTKPFTLGGDNGSTYLSFTFTFGTHTLVATPYSDVGGGGTAGKSFSVTFFVDQAGIARGPNIAPAVTLVSPTTTTAVAPGYSLLRANASDQDGLITKVEFWANGSLLSTTTNAPYLASWRNVAAGVYSVTARAYDNDGAITESSPAVVMITPQAGTTYYVSPAGLATNPGTALLPVSTITQGISLAHAGDTVLVLPGTYFESLDIKTSNITVAAQTPGTVIVDGTKGTSQRLNLLVPDSTTPGTNIHVSGIDFRNAASTNHSDGAAVRTTDGWQLVDCTVEQTAGNAIGVFGSNVTLLRVTAQNNGCGGIGGSSAKNAMILDCISRGNNTAGNDGSGEGGGGKFTRTDGMLVEGYNSYSNNGPGLWFDYNNVNIDVRNCSLHDNISLFEADGKTEKIDGTGLFFEISGVVDDGSGNEKSHGPLLAENNLIYNNKGRAITIYASAYVLVTGNTISGSSVELKDGRPAPFSIHDMTIQNNSFQNSRILVDKGAADNYFLRNWRIDTDVYDNSTGRLWNWLGTDYNSLPPIQALGFELHGSLGTVTFTPPASVAVPSPIPTPTPTPSTINSSPISTPTSITAPASTPVSHPVARPIVARPLVKITTIHTWTLA